MKYAAGILIVGVVVAGSCPLRASAAGDALFCSGQYEGALAAYEKDGEMCRPGQLMRMGECAVALKKPPVALQYWLRALRGSYGLSYLQLALRIHALQAEHGLAAATPSLFWYVATGFGAIPPLVWQLMLLLFLALIAGHAAAWWHRRRFGILFFMLFCLFSCSVLAWTSLYMRQRAVGVAAQPLNLRAGPDERFLPVGTVPLQEAVSVLQGAALPGGPLYYKVAAHLSTGWVPATSILVV